MRRRVEGFIRVYVYWMCAYICVLLRQYGRGLLCARNLMMCADDVCMYRVAKTHTMAYLYRLISSRKRAI